MSLKAYMVRCLAVVLASSFLAFGLYNVHSFANITEGGVLGMTLLLQHWFDISPAISGLVLNLFCYGLGWKILGKNFLFYSAVSAISFSCAYAVFEQFPPLFPFLSDMPLLAAVSGALFVGVGAGICVRVGGATGGDDSLAMSLSAIFNIKIEWIYLVSDLAVLGLSASYLPLKKLVFSLLTVVLSGQIVGLIQRITPKK